jgi:hypothetical protein
VAEFDPKLTTLLCLVGSADPAGGRDTPVLVIEAALHKHRVELEEERSFRVDFGVTKWPSCTVFSLHQIGPTSLG